MSHLTFSKKLRDRRLEQLHGRCLSLAASYPGFGHAAGYDVDEERFFGNLSCLNGHPSLRKQTDGHDNTWDEIWHDLRVKYGSVAPCPDDSDSLFRYRGLRWWGKFYNTDSRDPRLELKTLADEAVLEFEPPGLDDGPLFPATSSDDSAAMCKPGWDIVTRWLEIVYHVLRPRFRLRRVLAERPHSTGLPCGVFSASAIVVERLAEPEADGLTAFALSGNRKHRLTRQQLKALNFIKQKPGCKAITIAMHIGISVARFYSGYSRALKNYGVRVAHDGYFPPEGQA